MLVSPIGINTPTSVSQRYQSDGPIHVPDILALKPFRKAVAGAKAELQAARQQENDLTRKLDALDDKAINAMAKDVPMGETYRGVMGFVASDVVRIILLVLAPVRR